MREDRLETGQTEARRRQQTVDGRASVRGYRFGRSGEGEGKTPASQVGGNAECRRLAAL